MKEENIEETKQVIETVAEPIIKPKLAAEIKPEILEEENYDFDFSIYEVEKDETDTNIESIVNLKRPRITGLRSRFSNGEDELARIGELNRLISKLSIKVASRTQAINELWEYYGVLDEYWEIIRNIFGSHINTEIQDIKVHCRKLLKDYASGKIEEKAHNNLLFLRSQIYRLKQISNLGFEVERSGGGFFGKAKRNIEQ